MGSVQGQPIVVVGMHRSGTSLTARVLNLLGADLGRAEHMIAANTWENAAGYWEQASIIDLNERILEALGGTGWDPPPMPHAWEKSTVLQGLKDEARRVLSEQFSGDRLWAWKDPRASLILPFWQELVPNMRYVVCVRNPMDVAVSLSRRPKAYRPSRDPIDLWLQYTATALATTAGVERLIVFYEDYFEDAERESARLAVFAGLGDELESQVHTEIDAFIADQLWHYRTTTTDFARNDGVSIEARAFYLCLRATRFDPELEPELDALASALWRRFQRRGRLARPLTLLRSPDIPGRLAGLWRIGARLRSRAS